MKLNKFIICGLLLFVRTLFSYSLPQPDKILTKEDIEIIFSTLKLDARDELNQVKEIKGTIFSEIYNNLFKENTKKIKSAYFLFNARLQGFTETIYKLLYHRVKPSFFNKIFNFSFPSITCLVSNFIRKIFKLKFSHFLLIFLICNIFIFSLPVLKFHSLTHLFFVKRE